MPADLLTVLFLLLCAPSAHGQLEHGGKLFIHGGGGVRDTIASFVKLAGDEKAKLVFIPTATSDEYVPTLEKARKLWAERGISNVTILHTRSRALADTTDFVAPLRQANAVFIGGGDQQRLADAYEGTQTEEALKDLLQRGGVIGGTSAGAAIMSKVMIASGRTEPKLSTGLNFMPTAIVDQHFLNRSRLNRLMNAVRVHSQRTGIGIDERTALIVGGNEAKVIGSGYVTLVRKRGGQLNVETFQSGDQFELSDFGLTKPKASNLKIKGIAELNDTGRPLGKLVHQSIDASLELREKFLATKGEGKESLAKTIQRLSSKFTIAYQSQFPADSGSPQIFDFTEVDFETAIKGTEQCPSASKCYGPFEGKWYGRWAGRDVDHHWSRVFESADTQFEIKLSEFDVGWQYAWIGDGYGVNHCLSYSDQGNTKRFLLGYTEHLQNGDFSKVVARRPHVGIYAGTGKLIWITAREVFFEEAVFDVDGRALQYSIVGFNYSGRSNNGGESSLAVDSGFFTVYTPSPDNRIPFRSFEVSVDAKRLTE